MVNADKYTSPMDPMDPLKMEAQPWTQPQPEAEQLAKDLQAPLTTEDDHSICLQERGDFFVLVGFFSVVPLFWEGVDGCNLATSDVRMGFKSLFFRV